MQLFHVKVLCHIISYKGFLVSFLTIPVVGENSTQRRQCVEINEPVQTRQHPTIVHLPGDVEPVSREPGGSVVTDPLIDLIV